MFFNENKIYLSSFGLEEFDEIVKSSAAVVVDHFSSFSGWEKFKSWEALYFYIREFVSSGIRLGDDDVFVILKILK